MVKTFVVASVVADYSLDIVLLGREQAKDLTSPEDVAEPSAVGIRRKRLFLLSEFEISPPQGDINILGH